VIKKYRITASGGELYFTHKSKAIDGAKKLLNHGMSRVVHIERLSEELYSSGASARKSYKEIEIWELVNGVPKRTDNMRY